MLWKSVKTEGNIIKAAVIAHDDSWLPILGLDVMRIDNHTFHFDDIQYSSNPNV